MDKDGTGIGPYRADLVDLYWRWEQDIRLIVGFGRFTPESVENRRAGYEVQARGSGNNMRFTIYDMNAASGPVPIGLTSVSIDGQVRVGEFVIMLAPEHQGRGHGTRATWLTLDYSFHVADLAMVHLSVLKPNAGAIVAYEKAGFRKIGERRNWGYWLGERVNEVLMDALPEDFVGPSEVKRRFEQAP